MPKGPQPRAHRERAQPAHRRRLGLLEKHADYSRRAVDHARKTRRLTALRVRAQYRNPNEFAFGMVRCRKGSSAKAAREGCGALPTDVAKIMKGQDLSYIRMMKKVNEGRLGKLLAECPVNETESRPQRTRFYDGDCDGDDDGTSGMSESGGAMDPNTQAKDQRRDDLVQAEISIREARLAKLRTAERGLENQRLLMGKGKRKKIGVDADGVSMFKWAPIRKK